MNRSSTDWLQILGVSSEATPDEIRRAYLDLVEVWHPDRFQDERLRSKAQEKLKEINDAYDHLKGYRPNSRHASSPDSRRASTKDNSRHRTESLKTLHTAFSFVKKENASTTFQKEAQKKKLDAIAAELLNSDIAATACVEDVGQDLIKATLDLHKYAGGFPCFTISLSFGYDLRSRALTLGVGDYVKARGRLTSLSVRNDQAWPMIDIGIALTSVEVTQSPNYALLISDLDRPDVPLSEGDWFSHLRKLDEQERAKLNENAESQRRGLIEQKRRHIFMETGSSGFVFALLAYLVGSVGGCWHRFGTDPSRSLSYCFGAFTSTGPVWALCAMAIAALIGFVAYTNADG